jgi:copper chaperone NosL
MMKKQTRILLLIISLLLIGAYFFPIWKIDLKAPQYPEGLGMKIWINKMSGDLNTINGLNHYIGMKTIEPDSISELKIMPYVVGGLILIGLLAGFTGKKWILAGWVSLFIVAGAVGMYDFYMWEYDYGHNLNPNAAINVPGMSYQPPLIGSRKLLNFNASSYPDIGAYIFFGVAVIAILLLIRETRKPKVKEKVSQGVLSIASLCIFALLLTGCTRTSEPINFGTDECNHCRMTIMDETHGAELVTDKGKVFKYDATECMISDINEGNINKGGSSLLFVIDTSEPKTFIPANEAYYLISEELKSPMSAGLSAFKDENTAKDFQNKYGGNIYRWDQVKQIISGHGSH